MAVEQSGTLVPAGVIHCTIQVKYDTQNSDTSILAETSSTRYSVVG